MRQLGELFGLFGQVNMMSSMTSSRIARRPRAPVFICNALRATSISASSSRCRSTESSSKSFWYCLTMELRGRVRIWINSVSASSSRVATIGKRRGFGDHAVLEQVVEGDLVEQFADAAPFIAALDVGAEPIERWLTRWSMIFSSPLNAPPQMNRMLRVSIWMYSGAGACARRSAARWRWSLRGF